jgi:PIN domain nuclease of toxin-antitoxin system
MKVLLDTHTFLWYVEKNKSLSKKALEIITDSQENVCLSIISIWEIAIKHSIGKLTLHVPLNDFITDEIENTVITLLPINSIHCLNVAVLPFHHRDPFDRMIIAQALTENIPLISNEKLFDSYNIKRIW